MPDTGTEPSSKGSCIYWEPLSEFEPPLSSGLTEFPHRGTDGNRIEHEFSHPFTQGDMPPSPILGDILGEVWPDKVFRQGDSKRFRQTNGNVNTTREIPVDLNGIKAGQHKER